MTPINFILVLLTPFLVAAICYIPAHLAIFCACYFIYRQGGDQSLVLHHKFDFFYLLENYHRLLNYWFEHKDTLPFITHTLPIIVIPALCALLSLYVTFLFLRSMKERLES